MMRTKTRYFIIYLNIFTFLWAQTATALTAAEVNSARDFITQTQIATKSVTVQQMNKAVESILRPETKAALKSFVEKYGDEKMPVINVNKIKGENGEENVQLQIIQNGESAVITLDTKGPHFATLSGSHKGKDYNVKVSHLDMRDGGAEFLKRLAQQLDSDSQPKRGLSQETKSKSYILSYDQLVKLTPQQKTKYYRSLLKLVEAMDNVGGALQKNFKQVSWLDLIIEQAYAAADETVSCIVAGYPGFARSNDAYRCILSAADKSKAWGSQCGTGYVQCNPVLYGSGTCVSGNSSTQVVGYGATGQCNQTTDEQGRAQGILAWQNLLDGKSLKSKAEFDAYKSSLTQTLIDLQKKCTEGRSLKNKNAKIQSEFDSTCNNLDVRIIEILSVGCNDVKDDKILVQNELSCELLGNSTPPGPGPVKPTLPDEDNGKCEDYRKLYKDKTNEYKTDCGNDNGRDIVARCKDGVFYQCNCTSKFEPKKDNGPLVVRCESKGSSSSSKPGSATEKKEKGFMSTIGDFFKGPLFPMLLGGGLMLWLWDYQSKKAMQSYYSWLSTPASTPVPPPTAPAPSNVNRVSPTGIQ